MLCRFLYKLFLFIIDILKRSLINLLLRARKLCMLLACGGGVRVVHFRVLCVIYY
jgi:hypothetical protein